MIKAVQTAPEYQESPFWLDYSETDNGTIYDGLTIIDMQYRRTTRVKYTELFESVVTYADEAAEAVEDFKTANKAYYAPYCNNFTEYVMLTFRLKKDRQQK